MSFVDTLKGLFSGNDKGQSADEPRNRTVSSESSNKPSKLSSLFSGNKARKQNKKSSRASSQSSDDYDAFTALGGSDDDVDIDAFGGNDAGSMFDAPSDVSNALKDNRSDILDVLDIMDNIDIPDDVLAPGDLEDIVFGKTSPEGYNERQVDKAMSMMSRTIKFYIDALQRRNEDVTKLAVQFDKVATDFHNQQIQSELAEGLSVVTGAPSDAEQQIMDLQIKVSSLQDQNERLRRSGASENANQVDDLDEYRNQISILQRENHRLVDELKRKGLEEATADEDDLMIQGAPDGYSDGVDEEDMPEGVDGLRGQSDSDSLPSPFAVGDVEPLSRTPVGLTPFRDDSQSLEHMASIDADALPMPPELDDLDDMSESSSNTLERDAPSVADDSLDSLPSLNDDWLDMDDKNDEGTDDTSSLFDSNISRSNASIRQNDSGNRNISMEDDSFGPFPDSSSAADNNGYDSGYDDGLDDGYDNEFDSGYGSDDDMDSDNDDNEDDGSQDIPMELSENEQLPTFDDGSLTDSGDDFDTDGMDELDLDSFD